MSDRGSKAAAMLTSLAIGKAKPQASDYYLSDNDGTRGGGRLTVRVSPTGSKLFYFRYAINGTRKALPLLPFSARPADGHFTLDQARARARQLSELHRTQETRDVALALEAQHQARITLERAAVAQREEADQKRLRAQEYTLKALCDWYVLHLRQAGKVSWRDVQYLFNRYVAGSAVAALPASDLTHTQAAQLLRSVVDTGHGRTAAKLRAFLRAAYALALSADSDASAPAELAKFGIQSNPVANTSALSKFSKARERVLSPSELRAVWGALSAAVEGEGPMARQALALSLLLGGQRFAQLLRVKVQDADWLAMTLTLRDGKGRRQEARKHVLPLVEPALGLVRKLVERAEKADTEWLFASDQEGKVVVPDTVSGAFSALLAELLAAKTVKQPFQARDLRRTVETMMAALGVRPEVMAQVQSHGLGGVQLRHYNRHDYLPEKREALTIWVGQLQKLASIQDATEAELPQAELGAA